MHTMLQARDLYINEKIDLAMEYVVVDPFMKFIGRPALRAWDHLLRRLGLRRGPPPVHGQAMSPAVQVRGRLGHARQARVSIRQI